MENAAINVVSALDHFHGRINKIIRIASSVICILVFLLQAIFTDYFLVKYLGSLWSLWSILDVLVLISFIIAFIISNKKFSTNLEISETECSIPPKTKNIPGELPLGYAVWFFYSLVISIKFGIIFGPDFYVCESIKRDEFIGLNWLKTIVALCSIVFLFLVMTHHDSKAKSSRSNLIGVITGRVTIDILDTAELLSTVIFIETGASIAFSIHYALVSISCLNLILPTLMLLSLSKTQFGKVKLTTPYEIVHFIYTACINVPLIIIRSLIFHQKTNSVLSVFLIKNVLSIYLGIKDLLEHIIDHYEKKLQPSENDIELVSDGSKC